jgi:glycerophosphoryl diester phosphodiesterase
MGLPKIVAHRGASAYEPEHTMAAFRRAVVDGADAIECDVRLTRDGDIVCIHDRDITRTSDGSGVVSEQTLHSLQQADFGRWPSGRTWPGRSAQAPPEPVVRLAELLDLIVDSGLGLAIETKHPVRFGGAIEAAVVKMLTAYDLADNRDEMRIRVMSFSYLAVKRMADLAPRLPSVYLAEHPQGLNRGVIPTNARAIGPSIEVIRRDPDIVSRAHDDGREVHVWTVDEQSDALLCVERGVDAIITNRPSDVRSWLGAERHS